MTVNVFHGDCRDVLGTLPAASFDACVTDPPYGDTDLAWDRKCTGWIEPLARVLKPAASIWVFGSLRFLAPLFADMAAAGFVYSQDVVWEKQNGTGFLNDRFRRVHEHAVLFYRGAWRDVYHDAQYTHDATARVVRHKGRPEHFHGTTGPSVYRSEDNGPRLHRSVLAIPNEHGRAVYPTQKPIALLLPLVRYSCPLGGALIDPFAGSGSTGIAARIAGCDATLIEASSEGVATIECRLRNDVPVLSGAPALFVPVSAQSGLF